MIGHIFPPGDKTGRELTFRAEYQTLRKLRQSQAIVFSIRTYQFYLEDFKGFPQADTEQLVDAIENIHPEFVAYKSASFWKEASLQYLRRDVLGRGRRMSWSFSLPFGGGFQVIVALSVGVAAAFWWMRQGSSS